MDVFPLLVLGDEDPHTPERKLEALVNKSVAFCGWEMFESPATAFIKPITLLAPELSDTPKGTSELLLFKVRSLIIDSGRDLTLIEDLLGIAGLRFEYKDKWDGVVTGSSVNRGTVGAKATR